ncbi:MAG: rRNA maturation RNase YbeY [Terracidiphilus sp.]
MILLDPELDVGPSRKRPGLSELPAGGGAGRAPEAKAASPRTGWRRSALPWAERVPTPQTLARFLGRAQEAVGLNGQVTVLLTTDAAIRDLNRRFRHKNKATDVLSFLAAPFQNAKPAERVAGDVAISVDTARRQAAEQGHALTCELKVLVLHGVLHLAGYDHETDKGRMHRRERELRAELGLPEGLIERARKAAERGGISGRSLEKRPSGPKGSVDSIPPAARLKPRPFKTSSFSAVRKAGARSPRRRTL